MKKNGFTLSEIMVTLCVLGLLAAIIIPIIGSIKPNQNKILFKKAYYVTEKVVNDLVNDDVAYPEDAALPGFMNYTAVTIPTVGGISYGDASSSNAAAMSKFCNLFASKVNTMGSVSCTTAKSSPIATGNTNTTQGNFTTTDGITWYITTDMVFGLGNAQVITVDVTGSAYDAKTSPNCLYNDPACKTPDQFQIGVWYDGKLTVSGFKETEYLKSTSPQ